MTKKPSYEDVEQRVRDLEILLQACILSENALRESEVRYRRITEAVTDYIFTVRVENGRPLETTHGSACKAVTGYSSEEFKSDPYLWIRMVHDEDREIVRKQIADILSGRNPGPFEHRIIRKDGVMRWVRNTPVPNYDSQGNLISYDGLIRDIVEIKEAEEKREELVRKLQEALARVKQLNGLLPICAACKKIRDDKGYWQQLEAYIQDHSEAEFSHSICPECFKTLYPDFVIRKEGKA
jgi:PAS domain S-box-containing protein